MSKRVANRRGPSRNKAGRNFIRKALRRDLVQAREAEDKSWFLKLINKLAGIDKTRDRKSLISRFR
jgi:hypothetical protein